MDIEDRWNIWLLDEKDCIYLQTNTYPNDQSIVFYSNKQDIDKLRSLFDNPSEYNGTILMRHKMKVKEEGILKPLSIKVISPLRLRKYVGVDFLARKPNPIKIHKSLNGLLNDISDTENI